MNQIAIMELKIEVLGKQVDDLKCCGNCKHNTRWEIAGQSTDTHRDTIAITGRRTG